MCRAAVAWRSNESYVNSGASAVAAIAGARDKVAAGGRRSRDAPTKQSSNDPLCTLLNDANTHGTLRAIVFQTAD